MIIRDSDIQAYGHQTFEYDICPRSPNCHQSDQDYNIIALHWEIFACCKVNKASSINVLFMCK